MLRRTLIKLAGGLAADVHSRPCPAVPQGQARRGRLAVHFQWKDLDAKARRPAGRSPLADRSLPRGPGQRRLRRRVPQLKNPWAIGDLAALTQTSGWADAWVSTPSVYAVPARDASDVAAAVNFARTTGCGWR